MQWLNLATTTRLGVIAILCLFVAGCDRSPTAPALVPEAPLAATVNPQQGQGDFDILDHTITYDVSGRNQFASFADIEGNWYRLEADYDEFGRLVDFRMYVNHQFVGRNMPSWNGMEHLGDTTTEIQPDGFWVVTGSDHQLIDWGGGPPAIMSGGFDDGGEISAMSCGAEAGNFLGHSALVIGNLYLLGASALSTGPAAPLAVRGSLVVLGGTTHFWYRSARALRDCRSGGGGSGGHGNPPPIQMENLPS